MSISTRMRVDEGALPGVEEHNAPICGMLTHAAWPSPPLRCWTHCSMAASAARSARPPCPRRLYRQGFRCCRRLPRRQRQRGGPGAAAGTEEKKTSCEVDGVSRRAHLRCRRRSPPPEAAAPSEHAPRRSSCWPRSRPDGGRLRVLEPPCIAEDSSLGTASLILTLAAAAAAVMLFRMADVV